MSKWPQSLLTKLIPVGCQIYNSSVSNILLKMGGPRRNKFSLLIWQLWKNWSKVDTGRVPSSVECDKPVHFFVSNELIVNTLSCTEISDILWTWVGWFWQQKTHHCNDYDTVTVYTLKVNKIKQSYTLSTLIL